MSAHDATVTEATLMEANQRLDALGLRNAVHAFLSREQYLGDFVLGELLGILEAEGIGQNPAKDHRRRQEKMVKIAIIACEAVRLDQAGLWNSPQDASE